MKIRTFLSLVLIAGTFIVGFCSNCLAMQEERPKNYLQGQFGFFQPADDIDDNNFDTGLNGGVGYGRYLSDNLILEASFDIYATDRELTGFNAFAGTYFQDDYLYVSAALITLKGEVTADSVDIFGGVGVGVYGVTLHSEIDSSTFGSFDGDDSDSVFGAHVSLGAKYNITDYVFIGLEGKYRWTGDAELRETILTVPVQYEGNLNGFNIVTTIGFRFM